MVSKNKLLSFLAIGVDKEFLFDFRAIIFIPPQEFAQFTLKGWIIRVYK